MAIIEMVESHRKHLLEQQQSLWHTQITMELLLRELSELEKEITILFDSRMLVARMPSSMRITLACLTSIEEDVKEH